MTNPTCTVCNDTRRIPVFTSSGEQIGESRCPTCCDGIRLVDAQETARPLAEWHEDDGPVLWWKFPIEEPPYVGTPLDLGFEVVIETHIWTSESESKDDPSGVRKFFVGGWPGYHTHWTPLPHVPAEPKVEAS